MSLFSRLVLVAVVIMGGILVWDLSQERLVYPGKKLIIYAGMFGPGEPMQVLYAGPAPPTVPGRAFLAGHLDHYDALMLAWPRYRDRLQADYRKVYHKTYPHPQPPTPVPPKVAELISGYAALSPSYVDKLVEALGQSDRENRLKLYHAFADAHPQFDVRPVPPAATASATTQGDSQGGPASQGDAGSAPGSRSELGRDRGGLILTFEHLHPAYVVGLFEDFERRHPEYKVVQRWDGRWVLSSNRPRFLTGTDVPDIITGALAELRILMRENLGVPLDRPLDDPRYPAAWRQAGILKGEPAYDAPGRSFESEFYDWALEKSRYMIGAEDRAESRNPFPEGERVLYFMPRQVHTFIVFYNKAHFRLIGRDPNDTPRTVAEFEQVCRDLIKAGKEPIANDGADYINYYWDWLVFRQIGNANYIDTVLNKPGARRFAGPDGDPRYRDIARRLRKWRDGEFWMKGFSSSKWPAAQKDFGNGKCAFLFTGSWLPTEIASTRSNDPAVFDLGCFFFPRVEGGTGDADAIQISPQGYMLCRQGANTESAVLLLRYLTAYAGEPVARKLNYIATTRGVGFPSALKDIEPIMVRAGAKDFLDEGPAWYAPKFAKFVLTETYPKFFLIRQTEALGPDQYVEELERRAQEHYTKYGVGQ